MKKILLLVLSSYFLVFPASAQLVVGGLVGYEPRSTGYTTQGVEGSDGVITQGKYFALTTRVGFAFGNAIEVGIKPNASFSLYIYQTGTYSDDTKKWEMLTKFNKDWLMHSLAPYARLRLLHIGGLALVADVTGDLAWSRDDGAPAAEDTEYPLWGILVTPVASCSLGDHLSIDLSFNMFTVGYSGQTKDLKLIHAYQEDTGVDPTEFGVSAAASRGTLLSAGIAWRF